MKGKGNSKTIVIGIVGHIPPEFLADFKKHIESYPYFKLVIFKESNNKIWLVERGGDSS